MADIRIYGLILVFLLPSALSAPPSSTKVYRSDYTYSRKTDAFYKLHTESCTTRIAETKCQAEGAKLMLISTPLDIEQAHGMFKRFPDLGEFVLVAPDGQQHDSIEETPIIQLESDSNDGPACQVVTRDGQIEATYCYRHYPFMCKVDAPVAPYDEQCGAYGKDYISKISTTGSCYKIPSIIYSWNEARAECEAEGGHLVVLNSEIEHEVVWDILKKATPVLGSRTNYFFFAGIRANHPSNGTARVFRTVMNQTLEEAGYTQWAENEPNNYQDSEYCGSIFKNDGKYNDVDCSHKYAFVCEKERQIVGTH